MLGHVPNADMAALYRASEGIVFPTFFGPTNIPILEAWKLDTPVLTSDIRGIREQVGEAGILVDPSSVESIALGVQRLWTDKRAAERLVAAGRARLGSYGPEAFAAKLEEALERAQLIPGPAAKGQRGGSGG
jgi:glycosyltransferase involved in cell wall biosynthesis